MVSAGCKMIDNIESDGDKYIFHDDFYYESFPENTKHHLTPCLDEYFVRFSTEKQSEVMEELIKKGFQMTSEPVVANYSYGEDFEIPEYIKNGSVVSVKGNGDIGNTPGIIYSNHLYYDKSGELFGKSNLLFVYYDIQKADEHVRLIMQYADKLKILPINNDYTFGVITLACTCISSGNPVQIANWFIERGGFTQAEPDSGYAGEGD